uniref:Uncharacterized protein n=1 Tax=Marseillevirus LCMAC103 TaxID=2506604 RepID=A0A481YVE9_9VIRU|nr:MAG: hypothetical protein LCMAC103_02150 [Marseillevirus LCMAC103]
MPREFDLFVGLVAPENVDQVSVFFNGEKVLMKNVDRRHRQRGAAKYTEFSETKKALGEILTNTPVDVIETILDYVENTYAAFTPAQIIPTGKIHFHDVTLEPVGAYIIYGVVLPFREPGLASLSDLDDFGLYQRFCLGLGTDRYENTTTAAAAKFAWQPQFLPVWAPNRRYFQLF